MEAQKLDSIPIVLWRGHVVKYLIVWGLGNLANMHRHVDREDSRSLEGIVVVDQEGDTCRREKSFNVSVSGNTRIFVI
jgi:hypothetical protein